LEKYFFEKFRGERKTAKSLQKSVARMWLIACVSVRNRKWLNQEIGKVWKSCQAEIKIFGKIFF
jgi:hypothetical protein